MQPQKVGMAEMSAELEAAATVGVLASPQHHVSSVLRKFRRMQQRHSPLSTKARCLLKQKLSNTSPFPDPEMENLLCKLRDDFPKLHIDSDIKEGCLGVPVMMVNVGPIGNPRLCIMACDGKVVYKWQAFLKTICEGNFNFTEIVTYLQQLLYSSGYALCPGLLEYPSQIRFKTKHLGEWGAPFSRLDSDSCLLWHIPNNIHHPLGNPLRDACSECRKLSYEINKLADRAMSISDGQKLSRTSVSSNYPLKYLSPSSKTSRVSKIIKEKKNLTAKLSTLSQFDCDLNDKQHAELLQFVKEINVHGSKTIEDLCAEGDKVIGEDNLMREVWKQDVLERLNYEKDQRSAVTSRKGNRWSAITVRMALAVFTRSPAAYEALKSFKLLQLPSVRLLKSYIDSNLEEAGQCLERLQEEGKCYQARVEEQLASQIGTQNGVKSPAPIPAGDGVLIIDEVKVGVRLIWNSRSQKFVGHSMTHEEMGSLCDVYHTLSPEFRQKKTTYVLQTLWRDLTSQVDIIGPHYTSDGTMHHKFLLPTLMDAILKFHKCGFHTCAVVCDGASSNLTMIKEMSGAARKAYGFSGVEGKDTVEVEPSFLNPYTDRMVHFVICPSHQLKNMISALYQSRPRASGGTREFKKCGVSFGWQSLKDLYSRELQRMQVGQLTRVPKLKESHILRDSWTRLNVLPSKVMQQDEVISELTEHAMSTSASKDFASAKYLTALNDIFERTILGNKTRIFQPGGYAMQRLEDGFSYFKEWSLELKTLGCFDNGVECKLFLSWQTWDLLRVMVYGFRGLVVDFLSYHPGHHINPRRVNGSGVETLFGQLKHTTSGNLTAHNYETAKATMLTKGVVQGMRAKDDYRNVPLCIRQSEMRRKK